MNLSYCFYDENKWFLKANITKEMVSLANERYLTFHQNKNTVIKKDKLYAFLSEVCFEYIFDGFRYAGGYNYDYVGKDMQIDIKTTMLKVRPLLDFSAKILAYSVKMQNNSHYVFSSAYKQGDYHRVYFCGFISKKDVLKYGNFLKKGTIIGKGVSLRVDNYEVPYKILDRDWEKLSG